MSTSIILVGSLMNVVVSIQAVRFMEKEDVDRLIEKDPSLEKERLGLEKLRCGTYCLHRTFGMGQIVGYDLVKTS